jgi:ABC-type lipoprotein release transport system permease subunit
MSPLRLALRYLLLGQPRTLVAALLVAASLCVLDLFAGHIASQRTRLEYQAVVGERLGHLAIMRRGEGAFDAQAVARIRAAVESVRGVALVVPQIHLSGVASTGERAAFFNGAGIVPPQPGAPDVVASQPGRLQPGHPNGIAVSSGQARTLGLVNGSEVTLTGVAPDARPVPLSAQVVDIFSTEALGATARSLLMPFEMAQALKGTARTERLAVFLSNPREVDAMRTLLAQKLASAGADARVRSWRELSHSFAGAEAAARMLLTCMTAAVLAVIWAVVAATVSTNSHERRIQLAALYALGMKRGAIFRLVAAEALWIVVLAAALSLAASGLIAWVANRVALSLAEGPLVRPEMLVELDFDRMLVALAAVFAVAMLAALLPAARAMGADAARGLRCDAGHPGW